MIRVIVVGKNVSFLKQAEAEYLKRLGFYSKISLLELKGGSGSPGEVRKQEGKKLLEKAGENFFALDEKGGKYATMDFKNLLEAKKDAVFVIGGAFGLDKRVKERSGGLISLSCLTLTHQLARVLLLEQLYRAHTMIKGHPYNK